MKSVISLQSKRALVTGGSSGIGRAIAAELAACGARVAIAARSPARLEQSASDLGAIALPVDLSTPAAAGDLAGRTLAALGGLDILVLSSGIHMQGTIEELPESAFADLLGPNVIGPAALARSLAAALRESAGHIVIINSTVIRAANIGGRCYYAAGEHAMKAVADGLRDELNAAGISVTSVYPGVTATARQEMLFREAGRDYPAERILQPADVAAAVVASLSMRATAEITDLYIRPKNRI